MENRFFINFFWKIGFISKHYIISRIYLRLDNREHNAATTFNASIQRSLFLDVILFNSVDIKLFVIIKVLSFVYCMIVVISLNNDLHTIVVQ